MALEDFTGETDDELSFKEGDHIVLFKLRNPDITAKTSECVGYLNGVKGTHFCAVCADAIAYTIVQACYLHCTYRCSKDAASLALTITRS